MGINMFLCLNNSRWYADKYLQQKIEFDFEEKKIRHKKE